MDSNHKLLFEDETYTILGACFEVYKELGNGFLESVYQEALSLEFTSRSIPYAAQTTLEVNYKGSLLNQIYKPDFICYGQIIVELKAVSLLLEEHKSQIINYLKATNLRVGLLDNFGHFPLLEHQRLIL